MLQVQVFDEDTVSDDTIGEGSIDISKYKTSPAER